jgi:hypothetical protein
LCILNQTAKDLLLPPEQQGAGRIDVLAMVQWLNSPQPPTHQCP